MAKNSDKPDARPLLAAKRVRTILTRAARLSGHQSEWPVPVFVRWAPAGLEVLATNRFVIAGDTVPFAEPGAARGRAWAEIDPADLARFARALPPARSQSTRWPVGLTSKALRVADISIPARPLKSAGIPAVAVAMVTAPAIGPVAGLWLNPEMLSMACDWAPFPARVDMIQPRPAPFPPALRFSSDGPAWAVAMTMRADDEGAAL